MAKRVVDPLMTHISIDREIMGGTPVIRGTRFPVSQVLAELSEGYSVYEIADHFNYDPELVVNVVMEVANNISELLIKEVGRGEP